VKTVLGPIKISRIEENTLVKILKRNKPGNELIKRSTLTILKDVREKGDEAVLKYTKLYDKIDLSKDRLKVDESEISNAYKKISHKTIKAMEKASKNIRAIHSNQLPKDRVLKRSEGIFVKQFFRPICSVGLYVPGGRVPYPSTALMLGIPAKVSGVRKVVACSPPDAYGNINPVVLAAFNIVGVDEVYRVGGVQAIGAMAYGTETITKVEKILGPGNMYVTTAKNLVYGDVGVDFPAGPTEILIFADETADPEYLTADLFSQAEHDPLATAILVTTSKKIALEVRDRIKKSLSGRHSHKVVAEAIKNYGAILLADSLNEALDFVNRYAPEHIEIVAKEARKIALDVVNAGSISIGKYTPVAATDYAVGTSHVLPTEGAARFHSGLTVYDFLKATNVQHLTKTGLKKIRNVVETFSEIEGLRYHAESVKERLKSVRS